MLGLQWFCRDGHETHVFAVHWPSTSPSGHDGLVVVHGLRPAHCGTIGWLKASAQRNISRVVATAGVFQARQKQLIHVGHPGHTPETAHSCWSPWTHPSLLFCRGCPQPRQHPLPSGTELLLTLQRESQSSKYSTRRRSISIHLLACYAKQPPTRAQ